MVSEDEFPSKLRERLWHTTTPERYESIVRSGGILPNPDIPDSDRWKTSLGPHYYPFVRTLGGVSLFDFQGFDPEAYSTRYPLSNWQAFVPCRPDCEAAIWIEIDRAKIGDGFMSGEDLLVKWNHDNMQRHTIMPVIEAAHIGPIQLSCVIRTITLMRPEPVHHPITEILRVPVERNRLKSLTQQRLHGKPLLATEEKDLERIRAKFKRLGIQE